MGIFAKRLVRKHEELTFNYNVDRYGCVFAFFIPFSIYILTCGHIRHQAQTCYCGEPNCVGYIGGKTQTEFAAIDDLYLDGESRVHAIGTTPVIECDLFLALGITDENELMELKGTRKKKGKKIDDPDFMVRGTITSYMHFFCSNLMCSRL